MKHIAVIIISLCLLSFDVVAQQTLRGEAISIKDGDTFTFRNEQDRKKYKIELYGIACPVKKQEYWEEAKNYTSGLLSGKMIVVEEMGKDSKGNIQAFVYLPDNRMLNEALLDAGMAWHDIKKYKNNEWSRLEQLARGKKKGLWKGTPTAPWDFKTPGFFDFSDIDE